MVGGISGTTLTQVVRNLAGASDSTQVRGNQNELHVRSGFERFKEALSSAFVKSQSYGTSHGLRGAIEREYGPAIAQKLLTKYQGQSITAGTLRAMQHDGQILKLQEGLGRLNPLTSEISSGDNIGGLYKAWASDSPDPERLGSRAQQVRDSARSFAQLNVGDISKFGNLAISVHQSHGENRERGLELTSMIRQYRGTPAFDTMQALSNSLIDQDSFTSVNPQLTRIKHPETGERMSNLQVMDRNLRAMTGVSDQMKMGGVSSMAILGVQIGPRIKLLNEELAKQVNKFEEMQRSGALPEELETQRGKIESVGQEIRNVFSTAIENYKTIANVLQDPKMHEGLTEDGVRQLKEMGQHYGELALAFSDPQGPVQGLLSLAMVASANPMDAHALLHPAA